jgi:beta propeller repeat protein
VVWNYHGTTPDYLDDVYFWDGQFPITDHTTRITNDFDVDWYPDVSGSNVVWACKADLCLWDGTTTTLITTSDEGYVLSPARISGSNVVWECRDGNDSEICFWDGTFPIEIVQITNNETLDFAPAISGSNVVWHGDDGSDYEIYLWDGFTTTNISNNGTADFAPAISGSNVVWQCSGDICFWDGTFPIVPIQIGTGGGYLEISGSNVVWSGSDGNDQEIYMTYVPEPIFPLLMGSGLLGLAALNQRRKRKGI